jgi:hypothetical protein
MTIAEMVVLAAVLLVLVWLLRPLQRRVRDGIERLFMRRRYGKVIEGKFRTVDGEAKKPGRAGDGDGPEGGQT